MTLDNGESRRPGVRLTRMRIEEFRHVRPGTELTFHSGLNVLIGKNATGKTTLLNLISMALRADFLDIEEEEYKFDYQLQYKVLTLDITVENKIVPTSSGFLRKVEDTLQFRSAVSARYSDSGEGASASFDAKRFRFQGLGRDTDEKHKSSLRVTFQLALQYLLAAADLPPEIRQDGTGRQDAELSLLADELDERWDDRVRLDEALEFFKLIVDDHTEYEEWAGCFVPLWSSFVPKELGASIRKFFEDAETTSLTLHDGSLPFLHNITLALGFKSGRVQSELLEENTAKKQKKVGKFNFYFKAADNSMVPIRELSFGQKRLFSLLYYLSVNDQVAIVDEPTNGLHHEWIELFLKTLDTRQTFMATQHPLLLDYLTFDSLEEVQASFVQCRVEPDQDDKYFWLWSAMNDADAHRFYEAYKAGVQYVSEILVSKGLW